MRIMTPPTADASPEAQQSQAIIKFLPLMIGWFALNVPSGLSLYYFSNSIFTTTTQIYLKKLGGAKTAEFDLGPVGLGKGRRTGEVASSMDEAAVVGDATNANPAFMQSEASIAESRAEGADVSEAVAATAATVETVSEFQTRRRQGSYDLP